LFIDNDKAKYIDVQYYFIKEKVEIEKFISIYITSEDNVVNLLIKLLLWNTIRNFTMNLEL